MTIRRLTGGRKSLDDFCALFHGRNDNGTVWDISMMRETYCGEDDE